MTNQTVALSTGPVHYRDIGKPTNPVLLFLHAFPQDGRMWEPQWEHFQQTHRVIVPDFPGFGQSPLQGEWTIDSVADLVAELLTHLGVNTPVTVAGLSMGGYTAMAFARRHPERLGKLILADTKADPDDAEAKANRDKMIAFAQTHGSIGVINAMLPKLLGPTTLKTKPLVAEHVIAIAGNQSAAAVMAALKALRDRPDATPQLNQIAVPTLVIVGQEDAVTPVAKAELIRREVPNAQLVIIPEVGHLANLEDAPRFNQAIEQFTTT